MQFERERQLAEQLLDDAHRLAQPAVVKQQLRELEAQELLCIEDGEAVLVREPLDLPDGGGLEPTVSSSAR